ncbi:uncharacterized protein LOC103486945 isoform X4 [Cucumis melo]|uniref:Uncharacterized protein LOC103486945 isoform X4 n=2 Tax=Cucumis melo TaxID=3656 RepID=A0ABM3KQ44_CUCME|nr:uncharacterized protein LOC103486945 isoform X4 [Cucumis melo]
MRMASYFVVFLFIVGFLDLNLLVCAFLKALMTWEGIDERDDSSVMVEKDVTESVSSLPKDLQTNRGRENVVKAEPTRQIDMAGEINMEASMSADDVLRAGGFGARDEIGSFLPVASDSTDFEATILNARDYEGPQGEISRPGLGWKEATKTE